MSIFYYIHALYEGVIIADAVSQNIVEYLNLYLRSLCATMQKKVFVYRSTLHVVAHSFNINSKGLRSRFHFYFHYKISVDAGPKMIHGQKVSVIQIITPLT